MSKFYHKLGDRKKQLSSQVLVVFTSGKGGGVCTGVCSRWMYGESAYVGGR